MNRQLQQLRLKKQNKNREKKKIDQYLVEQLSHKQSNYIYQPTNNISSKNSSTNMENKYEYKQSSIELYLYKNQFRSNRVCYHCGSNSDQNRMIRCNLCGEWSHKYCLYNDSEKILDNYVCRSCKKCKICNNGAQSNSNNHLLCQKCGDYYHVNCYYSSISSLKFDPYW